MIVDCEVCPVRGAACDTCVINVLFSADSSVSVAGSADAGRWTDLDSVDRNNARQEALWRLSETGMVRALWAAPNGCAGSEKHAG